MSKYVILCEKHEKNAIIAINANVASFGQLFNKEEDSQEELQIIQRFENFYKSPKFQNKVQDKNVV